MRKENMLKALIILLNVALVIFEFGCAGQSVEQQMVDHHLQATQLYQDFNQDEAASNQKYVGKILEVIGTVNRVAPDGDEKVLLVLDTNADGEVHCQLNASAHTDLTKIPIGETIKVKGTCSGFLLDVMLDDCIIIKS